jgi:hypothetical protein
MPAVSENQQQAAGAALSAKRGETEPSALVGAAKEMYKTMTEEQLRHLAETPTAGLPEKVEKEASFRAPSIGYVVGFLGGYSRTDLRRAGYMHGYMQKAAQDCVSCAADAESAKTPEPAGPADVACCDTDPFSGNVGVAEKLTEPLVENASAEVPKEEGVKKEAGLTDILRRLFARKGDVMKDGYIYPATTKKDQSIFNNAQRPAVVAAARKDGLAKSKAAVNFGKADAQKLEWDVENNGARDPNGGYGTGVTPIHADSREIRNGKHTD